MNEQDHRLLCQFATQCLNCGDETMGAAICRTLRHVADLERALERRQRELADLFCVPSSTASANGARPLSPQVPPGA